MKPHDVMRILVGIAVICALVIGICLLLPRYNKLQRLQSKRTQLEQDNRQIDDKITDLADKERRFENDPAFVERTARESGMIKSNEVSYRVVN